MTIEEEVYHGVIGINDRLEIFEGYDATLADWLEGHRGEAIELADRMIDRWTTLRAKLSGKDVESEVKRLRSWIRAIGSLPDVDADNRGWMADRALEGKPAPRTD